MRNLYAESSKSLTCVCVPIAQQYPSPSAEYATMKNSFLFLLSSQCYTGEFGRAENSGDPHAHQCQTVISQRDAIYCLEFKVCVAVWSHRKYGRCGDVSCFRCIRLDRSRRLRHLFSRSSSCPACTPFAHMLNECAGCEGLTTWSVYINTLGINESIP